MIQRHQALPLPTITGDEIDVQLLDYAARKSCLFTHPNASEPMQKMYQLFTRIGGKWHTLSEDHLRELIIVLCLADPSKHPKTFAAFQPLKDRFKPLWDILMKYERLTECLKSEDLIAFYKHPFYASHMIKALNILNDDYSNQFETKAKEKKGAPLQLRKLIYDNPEHAITIAGEFSNLVITQNRTVDDAFGALSKKYTILDEKHHVALAIAPRLVPTP